MRRNLFEILLVAVSWIFFYFWYPMDVIAALIVLVFPFVVILFLSILNPNHFLDPATHPDVVEAAKKLPFLERIKIYWAVIVAGITDIILIIMEFILGLGD